MVIAMITLSWAALFATPSAQAGSKPVMAHYMAWFETQPYSGYWGYHWTLGDSAINPSVTNSNGQAEIASWYSPLIGPYDSADPTVLEYHVLLMKLAGIDGVIVDWYGTNNFNDYALINQRTVALFNYTRKAGLKFSLCYEDATIQQEINGNNLTAAGAISNAQQTLLYVQTNFFDDTSFLRWSNQPVFLNFGPQYFKQSSQWTNIFSPLNASNQPAFFTEDNRLSPAGTGAFDWPPMSLSQPDNGTNVLSDATLQNYLSGFEQKGAGWPAYVSSAFPRFHDYYAQAGAGSSYGYLADNNGATFTETLTRAMTNNSAAIQLVTWNDYGEGTIIEPTVQYGYRDLGVVQDFRRQYLDPHFSYHTNDLALALRLYNLRHKYGSGNQVVSAELDRVFTNIVQGNLAAANLQLTGVESNAPVIYNLSFTNSQLQFAVGGYLSASGIQIQTASNLNTTAWQTMNTLSVSTNEVVYSLVVVPQNKATFIRVQNSGS